jgi:sugar transferase (PEP-CTERM system associated)
LIRFLNAYFPKRTLFLGISEACLVILAFVAASIARLGAYDATSMFAYGSGTLRLLVLSTAFLICMHYFNLYDSSVVCNRREVVVRLARALLTMYAVLAVLYYLYPSLGLGNDTFQIGFALAAIALWLWRKLFSAMSVMPQLAERALLVGDGPLVEPLIRELEARPELGMRVVAHLRERTSRDGSPDCGALPFPDDAGGMDVGEEISRAVERLRVQRIVIAMGDRRGRLPVELLLSLKSRGIRVQDGTEVYEAVTGKVPIESVRLGWLLFSPGCYASPFFLFYKRLASLLISVVGLLISLPLLPFIMLAIKVTSPGRVLYRQKRVGRDGTVFDCYKFRTMREDAEADTGPTWAGDNDPRITRIGKLLRRTHIDEIPQLWNMLRGDMSFVGPRPERPEFVSELGQKIPYYHLRHGIRPGITGWAQVRYKYGSSIEEAKEKLRYDLFYIKNMNPVLDFLILFRTLKAIFVEHGAR